MTNTQSPAPGVAAIEHQIEELTILATLWKREKPCTAESAKALKEFQDELRTALQASAAAVPVTQTYVQQVPEQCDRITWRGRYYSLPLPAQVQEAEVVGYIGYSLINGKTVTEPRMTNHDLPIGTELCVRPPITDEEALAAARRIKAALASRTPAPGTVSDWGIDTSTGTKILVHKNCSVIQDEQAELVLRLLGAPGMAGGVTLDEVRLALSMGPNFGAGSVFVDAENFTERLNELVTRRVPAPHPSPAPQAGAEPVLFYSLPLGTRFSYKPDGEVWVILERHGTGLVAKWDGVIENYVGQSIASAENTEKETRALKVYVRDAITASGRDAS